MIVGTSDSKLHLLNTLTWFQTSSFDMNNMTLTANNTDELLNIYKETGSDDGIFYQALPRPYNLPTPQKIRGISLISVSKDGHYVAAKSDALPTCVFVWDLTELSLNSVII